MSPSAGTLDETGRHSRGPPAFSRLLPCLSLTATCCALMASALVHLRTPPAFVPCRHPHVLRAIATGQHQGLPFLVLEKLNSILASELPRPSDSVPFWTRRKEVKRWPLERALRVGKELGEALHYCHALSFEGCRVLHRDLKPNNIGEPAAAAAAHAQPADAPAGAQRPAFRRWRPPALSAIPSPISPRNAAPPLALWPRSARG